MRSRLATLGLAAAAGSFGLLLSPDARACSCAGPVVAPANGARDVPLNTRIWIPHYIASGQPVRLRTMAGDEVALDVVGTVLDDSGERLQVAAPRTPLAARTSYEIVPASGPIGSFVTGDAADTTPPAAPEGRLIKACAGVTPGSSCGPSYGTLDFDLPGSDVPLLVVTAGGAPPAPGFDHTPAPSPSDPNPLLFLRGSRYRAFAIGRGAPCVSWPFPSTAGSVFYGAVDLAGNFSPWRAGGTVALPELPPAAPGQTVTYCIDETGDGGVPDAADAAVNDAAPTPDAPSPTDAPTPKDTSVPADAPVPPDAPNPGDAPAATDARSADAASAADAGPADSRASDGGSGTSGGGDGCSCRMSGRAPAGALPLLLLGVLALLARRRCAVSQGARTSLSGPP